MTQSNSETKPVVADTGSASKATFLEELRPELLHRIFEYTLPHSLIFSFSQLGHTDHDAWTLFAAKGKHTRCLVANRSTLRDWCGERCGICADEHDCKLDVAENVRTQLLHVSKTIASEARGESHYPRSWNSQSQSVLTCHGLCLSQERFLSTLPGNHTNPSSSSHQSSLVLSACPIESISYAT